MGRGAVSIAFNIVLVVGHCQGAGRTFGFTPDGKVVAGDVVGDYLRKRIGAGTDWAEAALERTIRLNLPRRDDYRCGA